MSRGSVWKRTLWTAIRGIVVCAILVASEIAYAQEGSAEKQSVQEVPAVTEDSIHQSLQQLKGLHSDIGALEAKAGSAAGDNAWLFREEAREKRDVYQEQMGKLVEQLTQSKVAPAIRQNFSQQLIVLMREDIRVVRKKIQHSGRLARRFRALRPRKRGDERFELDFDLATERTRLDDYYAGWVVYEQQLAQLEKSETATAKELDKALQERAERLVTLIAVEERQAESLAKQQAATDSEKQRRDSEVQAAQQRARGVLESLKATVAHMKTRGIDTASLDQQVIEATGHLDTNVLDRRVALGLARRWLVRGKAWIAEAGPPILFKIVIFLLMLLVIRVVVAVVRRMVRGLMARRKGASALLRRFVEVAAGKAVVFLGLLIALALVGVNLAPVLAGLGIVGFVVGFALQDTLGNFAAGMLILLYRPFDEGDLIEAAGVQGTVAQLNLVSTTVQTLDNQRLILPNRQVWSNVIRNVFGETTRRVDLVFGISYRDDILRARQIIEQVLRDNEHVLADPAPVVRVHTLGDSSVDFVVRPWAKSEDYWEVHWSVTEQVKLQFDAQGISIPFPQRDVHLYPSDKAA